MRHHPRKKTLITLSSDWVRKSSISLISSLILKPKSHSIRLSLVNRLCPKVSAKIKIMPSSKVSIVSNRGQIRVPKIIKLNPISINSKNLTPKFRQAIVMIIKQLSKNFWTKQ